MSKFQLIKKALLKPNNKVLFSIYNTPKRKNFLLAPTVFAYNVDRREVGALPQKKTSVVTELLNTKTKLFNNRTNIYMSKQWLQLQPIRYYSTQKPTTQAELLAQARGFFERLKIRIKYPLMRQIRPWTLNDATALFSWLFLGHTVWLLAGTTSFVSLLLWLANSLQFQGKTKQ
jgi:hypothetical protein